MKRSKKNITINHNADNLFDIVIDIEKYPEFIPWCTGMHVHSKNKKEILADTEPKFDDETDAKFDDDIYPKQIHNFNNSSKNNNEPHSSETETETETSKAELKAKIIELQRKNEDLITRNTILQERIRELKGQKHALI